MSFIVAVMLLAVVTAVTCALPGVFLVLRGQSMLVDAMSHAVLPGIVVGTILSGSTHSPIMVVCAALMGLVVVLGAQQLDRTRLLTGDASQGVIFPVLFALGILLLSTTLSHIHICQDTVLTGALNLMALSPEHIIIGGYDIGPRTMWQLLAVCALNAIFIAVFFRVLKTDTFDGDFAATIGFPVRAVELGLMMLVSLTVVAAFNAAGAILVIALMVVPAATAILFARSLRHLLVLTLLIAVAEALLGFVLALYLDLATSAMMAFTDGVVFLSALAWYKLSGRAAARSHRRTLSVPAAAAGAAASSAVATGAAEGAGATCKAGAARTAG